MILDIPRVEACHGSAAKIVAQYSRPAALRSTASSRSPYFDKCRILAPDFTDSGHSSGATRTKLRSSERPQAEVAGCNSEPLWQAGSHGLPRAFATEKMNSMTQLIMAFRTIESSTLRVAEDSQSKYRFAQIGAAFNNGWIRIGHGGYSVCSGNLTRPPRTNGKRGRVRRPGAFNRRQQSFQTRRASPILRTWQPRESAMRHTVRPRLPSCREVPRERRRHPQPSSL